MATMLVLGGTAWLGREVTLAAMADGYDVTALARGESGKPAAGVRWIHADRSQADAYDQVQGDAWDVVVDVSWQPGMVRSALAALGANARQWV